VHDLSARGSPRQQDRARLADLESLVGALPGRFNSPRLGPSYRYVNKTAHGFTIGTVVRPDATTWVKSQADTAANAIVAGIVVSVPHANAFVVAFPGTYVRGLSSLTQGSVHYLSATTAGALVTTAPAIAVPVLLADSASTGVTMAAWPGGGIPAAAGDGFAYVTKSDGTGEWAKTVDLGTGHRTATATVGAIDVAISTDGDSVLISDAADGIEIYDRSVSTTVPLIKVSLGHASLNATGRALSVREIDVCDGGTAKKMLVLASAPY
jgi:hypothetical protein